MNSKAVFESYVKMDEALNRVRGNKKLYRKMLDMFMDSAELVRLEEKLEAGEINEAADLAHAVKGVTGNMSFPLLYEISTELMNSLRAGKLDKILVERYYDVLAKTKEYVVKTRELLDADI